MWEDCEGVPGNACGKSSHTELLAFILVISGLSASQPIFVEMKDVNNVLYWLYSYDGNTWMQYDSFTPPPTFKQVFYLGTTGIFPYGYPYFTAYFYQFGMWSQSPIGCKPSVNVEIQNPSYYQSGNWHTVAQAESMQGLYTYYDYGWTLSDTSAQVNAQVPQPSPQVTFLTTCFRPLADNTILWG